MSPPAWVTPASTRRPDCGTETLDPRLREELSGLRNGRPLLVPEEDRRVVHDAMRLPNLLTSLQPDYLLTFVLFPLSPGRTRVVASTYVHEDEPWFRRR